MGKQAGALHVLGIYSLLSWFLEFKTGIELQWATHLLNQPCLQNFITSQEISIFLQTVRLNQDPNLIMVRK